MCALFFYLVVNSRCVIFGYKTHSYLCSWIWITTCRYCVAQKSYVRILVNLRTVVIASVCCIWDSFLWPSGTPAGRDIAIICVRSQASLVLHVYATDPIQVLYSGCRVTATRTVYVCTIINRSLEASLYILELTLSSR